MLEVNQPHAHTRRRLGKSDPIDAELAARAALAGKARTIPKQTGGIVESIRQLRVARQGAVKARSAAMAQLKDLIITAPEPLHERLCEPKTIRGKASRCRRLRPSSSIPLRRRALRCARSHGASSHSTGRSPHSMASSSGSSAQPHRARARCLASRPAAPVSCW